MVVQFFSIVIFLNKSLLEFLIECWIFFYSNNAIYYYVSDT
jgi:hypothetical protein